MNQGERSASFSGFINGKGDFLSGIADMDILSHIPESHLKHHNFQASKILVIDSNIGTETLSFLLHNAGNVDHIIYEPISKEKSTRILLSDLLSRIDLLKPNLIQLRDIYANLKADSPSDAYLQEIYSDDIEVI